MDADLGRSAPDALSAFPQRLQALFDSMPADTKNRKPTSWEGIPSEPFSAIEQICDVRDTEVDGDRERFRRNRARTHETIAT